MQCVNNLVGHGDSGGHGSRSWPPRPGIRRGVSVANRLAMTVVVEAVEHLAPLRRPLPAAVGPPPQVVVGVGPGVAGGPRGQTRECAVKSRGSTVGAIPTRQTGSLQPVAIGAAVEVTKPSEPSRQMYRSAV